MSKDYIYKCLTCKKKNIICAICKSNHAPKHEIINYERNNYRCSKHKEKFIEYCHQCKKNICFQCHDEHSNHESEIESLNGKKLFIPKEKIDEKLEQIKKTINKFNN